MPLGSSTRREHYGTVHARQTKGHGSQATGYDSPFTGYGSQERLIHPEREREKPGQPLKDAREEEKERKRKQREEVKERKRKEKHDKRLEREMERERAKEEKNARMQETHRVGYADQLGIDPISDLRLTKRAAGVSLRRRLPGFRW
ncbi:MAG: hypothetical protein Q9173_005473 [Seirophora scorigena]